MSSAASSSSSSSFSSSSSSPSLPPPPSVLFPKLAYSPATRFQTHLTFAIPYICPHHVFPTTDFYPQPWCIFVQLQYATHLYQQSQFAGHVSKEKITLIYCFVRGVTGPLTYGPLRINLPWNPKPSLGDLDFFTRSRCHARNDTWLHITNRCFARRFIFPVQRFSTFLFSLRIVLSQ